MISSIVKESAMVQQKIDEMILTDDDRRILAQAWRRGVAIAAEADHPFRSPGRFQQQQRRKLGPEFNVFDWLKPTTDAERQRLTRRVHKLETAGLLECHRPGGQRITHVRLSLHGRKLCESENLK